MNWLLILLLAPGAAAVPPPVEQTTAQCGAPVYASDHLVCGDPELLALDARLASVLASAPPAVADGWVEGHAEWFRRRSRCAFLEAHRQCLSEAYTDRLELLGYLVPPKVAGSPASCRGADYAGTLQISGDAAAGRRVLVDPRTGGVVGVAAARNRFGAWTPSLAFESGGAETVFTRHDGTSFRCRALTR